MYSKDISDDANSEEKRGGEEGRKGGEESRGRRFT